MGSDSVIREAPYKEKKPRRISIETFLRKYREGAPGVKYEYNKGIIEKTETMKFKEQYLVNNLLNKFDKTPSAKKGERLIQELEVWTSEKQWRKPDLCLTTPQQVAAAANGEEPIPEFIIEVISPNDNAPYLKGKVREYLAAGVKIVWLIFPHLEVVEVHRSPKQSETLEGDQLCSAEPVAEGFKIKVADIFKKP